MTTGRPGRWAVLVAGAALLAATGCGGVNRRFVIESNVPNAQVYINNQPVGAAPAHATFEYYGHYNIELVHPDYQREAKRVHVVAPWYAYPPFDLIAVLWPFRTEDVRRYYFELTPLRRPDTAELLNSADSLRQRGWNLPIPAEPAPDPKAVPPAPVVPPGPEPTPLPAPGTIPGPTPAPSPLVPSVTPTGSSPVGGTFLR